MHYTLKEIAATVGSTLTGSDMTIEKIISDSRNMIDGESSIFIAIVGSNHNGHNYVKEMYERGVRAFMVSEPVNPEMYPEAGFLKVANTITALHALAAHHRKNFRGKVVAITGSNGKTVTKEWIAQLCPPNIKMFRSPRSYNSQLGVPLSILMLEGDEQIAIIEAGISRKGEMEKLEKIIKPNIGIITNIGSAHQENFSSLDEKLSEKLTLFNDCDTIIYNSDKELIASQISKKFSAKKLFDIGINGNGISYEIRGDKGISINFISSHRKYAIKLPFSDIASVENAMDALSLYLVLGFEPKDIIPNIENLQPVAMRLELKEGVGGGKIINDSYNSDINSLSVAIDYLVSVAASQPKVLILSDIFQTGLTSEELYEMVAHLIEIKEIDKLFGIGENISNNRELFSCEKEFFATTADFLNSVSRKNFAGNAVLIKGSRQFQFEKISRFLEHQVHTTVLEVDLDAMIHNLNEARAKLKPGVKLMAMVKALSYGSGSYEVAAMLQHQRVDFLAVAFADEGITLREGGINMPIVVLNADSWSFSQMIEYNLEPEIYSFSSLKMFIDELIRHGEHNYPIHLKLDTGMHRLGFQEQDIDKLIQTIKHDGSVTISTIFTHLAASDDPSEDEFTKSQLTRFEQMSSKICATFPHKKIIRHAANSSAIERMEDAQFDMVRLGIGLYGISFFEQAKMQIVSTLKSKIVQIKELSEGETVGYGRHGKISSASKIATVPIGYADGLDRRLSNGAWSFSVGGRMAPIIGNICMDTCMIDVTGIDVNEGDDVVIFGENPTVTDMAIKLETIPYEIFTSISTRVKRIYLKE